MAQPARMLPARFEAFARERLAPALVVDRNPLEVAAWQCREPVPHALAARARYKPVRFGWEWGPAWSTCWFRLRGRLPRSPLWRAAPRSGGGGKGAARHSAHLRFSSDTEALLWVRGVPVQGFDANRDTVPLGVATGAAAPGSGGLEFLIEAACNHPFGARGLAWDSDGEKRRWESPAPGRLLAAELVLIDAAALRLQRLFVFAVDLLAQLAPPAPAAPGNHQPWAIKPPVWQEGRSEELAAALERVVGLVSARGAAAAAVEACRLLETTLAWPPGAEATVMHAVGHAHIDTAWLWPLRETRRKCLRTFSNALGLMDRHQGFRFLCTQAAQYAMVERDSPELFVRIKARVRQGRWEAGGAMWVEPDCNVPSGESLIRQILHGTRYWRERFGERHVPQRMLFLPDTFGFPACLPQIMAHAGLDTFITNKLSWNDTNTFPHTTFWWRGLGDARVLAHCTPGHDYNATVTPRELRRGDANHKSKQIVADGSKAARWLQPYGFGDGGGGPTSEMLHRIDLAATGGSTLGCAGLPRAQHGRADDFCAALHRDVAEATRRGVPVPAWHGDLYLELHRGTLTTQGWLKRANRDAEDGLRLAEMLAVSAAAAGRLNVRARSRLAAQRDAAWKLLLLNQFHDILPGSSIGWVYDDARRDHARVAGIVAEQVAACASALAGSRRAGTRGKQAAGTLVFNPGSGARQEVVQVGGRLALTPRVEACGWARVDAGGRGAKRRIVADGVQGTAPSTVGLAVDTRRRHAILSNGLVEAVLDPLGRITSLRTAGGPEVAAGPLGDLAIHGDTPRMWDAWDIDAADHARFTLERRPATSWRVAFSDPLRAILEVSRPVGTRSRMVQTISLDAASPIVVVRCRLEWRERHTLLRAVFPAAVNATHATLSTQFGHITRPTHKNTTWEQAAFEVPVQRWMDLSQPGAGLSVLNDSKYGASVNGGTLGLSLARSPTYPDPEADQGDHEFAWGLVPHTGDWRSAHGEGVEHLAERMHRPVRVFGQAPAAAGVLPASIATIEADEATRRGITISALKPAEWGGAFDKPRPGSVVLRLAEVHGRAAAIAVRWSTRPHAVSAANAMDEVQRHPGVKHDRRRGITSVSLRPFEIVSLLAG